MPKVKKEEEVIKFSKKDYILLFNERIEEVREILSDYDRENTQAQTQKLIELCKEIVFLEKHIQ